MTMLPIWKKCPLCGKKYSWNPDVGKMWCPQCGIMGAPGAGDIPFKKLSDIFKKKDKKQFTYDGM